MKKQKKVKDISGDGKVVLLSRKHDVSLFTAKGDTVQSFAHYNAKTQCVEATNGRVVIRVPADVQESLDNFPLPESCVIPVDALQQATKGHETIAQLLTVKDVRSGAVTEGRLIDFNSTVPKPQTSFTVEHQTFPATDAVIDQTEPKLSIALSADVLKRIALYALKYSPLVDASVRFDITSDHEIVRFVIQGRDKEKCAYGAFVPSRLQ